MIRQLLRENLRAHRPYLIWTTALLTVAVAMASFATFSATQASAIEDHVAEAYGIDGPWHGGAYFVKDVDNYVTYDPMTPAEVADIVAQANDEGAEATAMATLDVAIEAISTEARDAATDASDLPANLWDGATLTGAADWDAILVEGDAPEPGQVAVSAAWADDQGIRIGDTVWAHASTWEMGTDESTEVDLDSLTVSGLIRDSLPDTYWVSTHEFLLNWDTAAEYSASVAAAEPDSEPLLYSAEVSAATETPALAALDGGVGGTTYGSITSSLAQIMAIAAAVLAAGLIGMAFAVGRSQAQARTSWVATARVLGARRSAIVGATMLEVLGVGLVAGVVGTAAGAAIVAADWLVRITAHPDAFVPSGVALPSWAWLAMLGLALVVAGIVGGIPAFWAARTAPAAALKPVTPATQAEVSRTVPVWPLYALWALLSGAFLTVYRIADATGSSPTWVWVAAPLLGLAAGVTSIAVCVDLTRRAVAWVGTRLAAATTPWRITAGHAITGRPRQASGPASVLALATTTAIGITTWTALANWAETSSWTEDGSTAHLGPFAQVLFMPGSFGFGRTLLMVTALCAATLVAVALGAFLSLRQATAAEDDAATALGLDAGDARAAGAAQFAFPLVTGVAVGTMLGIAGAVSVFSYWLWAPVATYSDGSSEWDTSTQIGPWWALTHLSHAFIPIALVAGIVLACAGVGAAIVALTTRVAARPLERTSA
ncbi:FtsX-like permease family protein [Demequina salsinemoris]|uniref:FtsX-like permease family protein n=1 Tax=Demequina salsinemoris TaxID=577470 RepID=UPI000786050C|nr:FtsX-like permease family protein [Demequina salsinemoris]